MKTTRLRIIIRGTVQGVGFRPFIYRLAVEMGLAGWVRNNGDGVFIETEGPKDILDKFLTRIQSEKPEHAYIQSLEPSYLDATGYKKFEILESQTNGTRALILPDIATCPDCRREIRDPQNRHYRYPFTNCTHCGPRYSIIERVPYDRENTSMKIFDMCDACRKEYDDPRDRRFHAQPNACPQCGPQLELWDEKGAVLEQKYAALEKAAAAIAEGKTVALKGLGGFQLLADARNEAAVKNLRERKHRMAKPFALMYPDMESARRDCFVSPLEERLLASSEAPIVLLKRKPISSIAQNVAPDNPYLGVMLPYTPLHILLMDLLKFPVVATSGNVSEEPICIDEKEALQRLQGTADYFLVHNRPILRHVDDSIVRIMSDREMVLRRARGYAPLPIPLKDDAETWLAVGPHLKNTICVTHASQAFISQHIGDLETQRAYETFQDTINDMRAMHPDPIEKVIYDLHPEYLSTKYALSLPVPLEGVQHHCAHVLSCMLENELDGDVLGVCWDGTGWGCDHTIWGGEFLKISDKIERVAHFKTFSLPGGEMAVKEPRRTAFSVCHQIFNGNVTAFRELAFMKDFTDIEIKNMSTMIKNNINSPLTSSAGRLFDAVSALLCIRLKTQFEGQAAMELEFALDGIDEPAVYPFKVLPENGKYLIDYAPLFKAMIEDLKKKTAKPVISARFHNTMAEIIVAIAKKIGLNRAVLSGGCFQNKYLTERSIARLLQEGFSPYWHQRVPPNDGGIALGQIGVVLKNLKFTTTCDIILSKF